MDYAFIPLLLLAAAMSLRVMLYSEDFILGCRKSRGMPLPSPAMLVFERVLATLIAGAMFVSTLGTVYLIIRG